MRRLLRALIQALDSIGHDLNTDHPMRPDCCPLNPSRKDG